MSLVASKHADEIRELWQSRALRESQGKLRRVLVTVIAKEYPGALVTLLKVTFPGFVDLDPPILTGYAAIAPDGAIACDMLDRDGQRKRVKVYDSENDMLYALRMLADNLKLSDKNRVEMFTIVGKWVASDQRIDHNGRKLAS